VNEHEAEVCDDLDASIFTGDSFYDEEALRELEHYLARWTREAARIRKMLSDRNGAAPWLSIDEVVPLDGEKVLFIDGARVVVGTYMTLPHSSHFLDHEGNDIKGVTDRMSQPKVPRTQP
jgi:hypothetical protein